MNALMTRSPLSSCFILFSNPTLFWFYLCILLLAIIPLASAVQNITITASNPAINYQPSEGVWNAIGDSSATNGAFRLARTQNGVATMTRSFHSVHFVAPLWPIPVQVQISVGDITQVIDLQDYTHDSSIAPPTGLSAATQPSQIRWSFHGTDGERAVRVNAVDSGETGWIAVVDSLIFEVMEPGDPPVPASSSPASPTSGSLATGSDDTDTDPNSRGSVMINAPGPSSTPSVADNGFPVAGTAGNHQENESTKRKVVIISSSVCASVLILLLGGAGMWCWRRRGNRKRVVSRLDEGKRAIGGGSGGDCDEKGYMGRQDLEKAKLQFGALVHISTDAPKLLDTKGPSPTFLDSYSHPQGTPTSSDGASISTFSATSKDSMHEAMLGLGVMYGAGGGDGVGRRVKSVGSLGSAGHEHGSPSSSNSLLTAESSSFLLEESSQQSHLMRGVIRQAEMVHFQASSSHLRLDRSIECARASSVLAIPVFETPISSRDTSAAVTPSTEFGSAQWHEVVGGFPTPPNSAAIMGCGEFSSVDRETSAGDVGRPVDGRRDSCWSDSFPFPIPRMPLPGLPYPPKSAPATQSSFRFIPQHANSVARASPLAHDAIRSFDSLRYSESHQQQSTRIPPVPAVNHRRPLPALPTPKTSSSKSPLQSSSHYLITEENGNENANTPMSECEVLVPPHITCTSPSTDGLLTPPPSGRGSNFALALSISVGQEPNGGPYHSRSPFASSLDTLGRLEAQLYS